MGIDTEGYKKSKDRWVQVLETHSRIEFIRP